MLKIGHRGAEGYEPENTMTSFRKAIELGADGIELDVHLSADGHVVVIHDHTLERTTNGNGAVSDLSLQQLKLLRIVENEQVPTLIEVLDEIKDVLVNIELKGDGTALPVVEIVQNYIGRHRLKYQQIIVSSFDWVALQQVAELDPEIPIGVLTATDLDLAIGFAEFINAKALHPQFHLLTTETTKQMQQKGFRVLTWTVNEPEDINLVKSYNVDGIISDFPDRL
ncbi:MAG TPA: glycerophosphodiester phosphodiesterase family protein [Flavobacterium sp.]|jgi:glycerophosphoryl diester phosphodiesterase